MPCSSKALPAHKARETYIRFVAARGRNRAQLFLGCRGNAEIEVRSKPRAQAETVLNSAQSNRTSVRPHRNFATASATQGAILKRNTVYHIYRRAPGSKGCGKDGYPKPPLCRTGATLGGNEARLFKQSGLPRSQRLSRDPALAHGAAAFLHIQTVAAVKVIAVATAQRVDRLPVARGGRRARGSLHYLPIRIRKSRFRGRRSRFSARTGRTTRRAGGLGQAHRLCFLKQYLFGLLPSATACLVSKPWVRYKGISCRFLAKIKSQHTWLPT